MYEPTVAAPLVNVNPAGTKLVKETPVAFPGPLLVTVIVYEKVSFTFGVLLGIATTVIKFELVTVIDAVKTSPTVVASVSVAVTEEMVLSI